MLSRCLRFSHLTDPTSEEPLEFVMWLFTVLHRVQQECHLSQL